MDAVAVIVPCYNAERTLGETLDSVLSQEAVTVQIVVVDDGSKDGSLARARRYEPRVHVITGPNRGASAARNAGIAAVEAPWFVFLDADDLLQPGTLAKRVAIAKERQAGVVISGWREVMDDGSGPLREGAERTIDWGAVEADAELAVATHVWAPTAAILYSSDIVARIGGFRSDLPIIQDARFLFDAAFHGARFARSDDCGAVYRVLEGSLSRGSPERFVQDLLVNAFGIEAMWRTRGDLDDIRRQTLLGMLNMAGRGLFRVGHESYFEAVAAQARLGLPLPMHSRIAPKLAKLVGLPRARSILSLIDRG